MIEDLLKQENEKALKIRGFYRVQIDEDGKIKGDSGWLENQITDSGVRYFLAYSLGSIAGSLYVSHAALGTGTVPASNATTLNGEIVGTGVSRATVAAASSGSTAVQFTATFASSASFCSQTENISNIGLFNSNASGTLFAGNTYASSSCATNQNVNVTYTITFTR